MYERALEIQEELKELTDRGLEIATKKNELKNELLVLERDYKFEFDYVYNVKSELYSGDSILSFSSLKGGDSIFRINRIIKNYDEYKVYYELFKPLHRIDENVWSVTYYRKFGVLLRCGGGYIILKDEVLCSDKEWNELIEGNVDKFLK